MGKSLWEVRDAPLLALTSLAFQAEATEDICTACNFSGTADRTERPSVNLGSARTGLAPAFACCWRGNRQKIWITTPDPSVLIPLNPAARFAG